MSQKKNALPIFKSAFVFLTQKPKKSFLKKKKLRVLLPKNQVVKRLLAILFALCLWLKNLINIMMS
jgi:hypothetical protein